MGRAVQVKLTVVRLLLYCLTYFFIFRSYYWFAGVMNQVIDLHFWFLDICWGIFGVTYAKVFMDKVMPLIIVPLKMIELASIATDSVSIRECGSTVMKKFGQVSIIVTVNALLRVVLNKAYDKLEADWFKRLYDRLKQSKVKSIVNFAENVLYTITDNIDECVICSCFMLDETLYDSLVFSIKNLWRSMKEISLSAVSLHIFIKVLNFCTFVVYVYYAISIWRWDTSFVVQVFLYYFILRNLLRDVIYTPMIYRVVCSRFVNEADMLTSDYSEEAEQILTEIPELEKIKSIVEKINE